MILNPYLVLAKVNPNGRDQIVGAQEEGKF